MDSHVLALAADVISQADRQRPADQVLRIVLRQHRQRYEGDPARVVRAVFAYFRWFGWLDERMPLPGRIEAADALAERFAHEPERFQDDELASRAIPAWAREEMNTTPAWLRSLQAEPRLWLRARRGQGPSLAEKLGHCRIAGAGVLGDTLEYQGDADLFRTEAFHAGELEVQDLNSQAVGFICAPGLGETWWDACAGEGGKTLHLSDLMENQGLIWATDRAAWRLQKLKRRAARARVFNYRSAIWQEGSKLPTKTKFDGVLLDAPCSGMGTWQRNPHARWTTSSADVKELAAVQEQLLTRVAGAVKPGGKLVYSVCTLARSETVTVADAFERQFPEFEPAAEPIPWEGAQAPRQARLSLWPHEFGGNGMFVAVWRRR